MYAGCVIWPLHLDKPVGLAAGGLVALIILIQYIVGLTRRLKQSPNP
ncbi:MAG: hypothetical protein ACETWR_00310 [Anaerolineae bacterium]